jgi:hypothetical protein
LPAREGFCQERRLRRGRRFVTASPTTTIVSRVLIRSRPRLMIEYRTITQTAHDAVDLFCARTDDRGNVQRRSRALRAPSVLRLPRHRPSTDVPI